MRHGAPQGSSRAVRPGSERKRPGMAARTRFRYGTGFHHTDVVANVHCCGGVHGAAFLSGSVFAFAFRISGGRLVSTVQATVCACVCLWIRSCAHQVGGVRRFWEASAIKQWVCRSCLRSNTGVCGSRAVGWWDIATSVRASLFVLTPPSTLPSHASCVVGGKSRPSVCVRTCSPA